MTHKEDPAGEARQNLKDWKPKEPRRPFRPKPDSFGPSMKFPIPKLSPDIETFRDQFKVGDWPEEDQRQDEQEPNGSPQ